MKVEGFVLLKDAIAIGYTSEVHNTDIVTEVGVATYIGSEPTNAGDKVIASDGTRATTRVEKLADDTYMINDKSF